MAQATVLLMCGVGSFLVGGDAVVIHCDHPANPSAQSAPAIVVPRIKNLGVKSVKPNLGEEGAGSAHKGKDKEQTGSDKGGAGQTQQQPASAKDSDQQRGAPSSANDSEQHQQAPSSSGSAQQHQGPSSTSGSGQHQH